MNVACLPHMYGEDITVMEENIAQLTLIGILEHYL